ncbi:AAA family ATPase [Sphingopyxis sp. R3-92]|uniref:AAA family ATPase n=1 Tax=Sphingopyxis sp. R3-92 TaxID=3158553 RepID=UPI003EE4322F
MDEVRNPFVPGAGTRPPELAGRDDLITETYTALLRIEAGKTARPPILVGLRGVGKTVLLNRMQEMAAEQGFLVAEMEACDEQSLPKLLAPKLREIFLKLSLVESAKDTAKRGLGVLKAFLGGLGLALGDFTITFDPTVGVADSGQLKADLPALFEELGAAAAAAKRPVAIFIDELQSLKQDEFSALIMAVHKVNQRQLPILFIGAGLPQVLALAGNAKSYSERLFNFSPIDALSEEDAVDAIVNPALAEGVKFEPEAISEILRVTERYPYYLQQWAHDAWNIAEGEEITWRDVIDATPDSTAALDRSFFRVRYARCSTNEKIYMRALAELGPGHKRSADVAQVLGKTVDQISPARAQLIKKTMIFAQSPGLVCFTVPLFDQFMKRVHPQIE